MFRCANTRFGRGGFGDCIENPINYSEKYRDVLVVFKTGGGIYDESDDGVRVQNACAKTAGAEDVKIKRRFGTRVKNGISYARAVILISTPICWQARL